MDDLAVKILNEKINGHIDFINNHGFSRCFDRKTDLIYFYLTDRQFAVIQRHFKLKMRYVLCRGLVIDKFIFNDYTITTTKDERKGGYFLIVKHRDYIEDIDAQLDYLEATYHKDEK